MEFPSDATVTMLAGGELGTAALMSDGTVYAMGMGRFFEPTKLPGAEGVDGTIVDMQVGAYHIGLLTDTGKLYTFGTGTALALPKVARPQWELAEVNAHWGDELQGKRVVSFSCGPYSTAMVVA